MFFCIRSGLPCYLEFCAINGGSALLPYHDFSCTSSSPPFSVRTCMCIYLCMRVGVYVYSIEYSWVCIYTLWNILSQAFLWEEIRSGLTIGWMGMRKGNLKYWPLLKHRSRKQIFLKISFWKINHSLLMQLLRALYNLNVTNLSECYHLNEVRPINYTPKSQDYF